jgi:hypothetical protein
MNLYSHKSHCIRATIGISMIALLTLVSISNELWESYKSLDQYNKTTIDITAFENRFARLIQQLPPVGVLGYIDDTTDPVNASLQYTLTRYALAPRLLERSKRHEMIIGNFHQLPPKKALWVDQGLILIEDFGDGVLLFSKRQR